MSLPRPPRRLPGAPRRRRSRPPSPGRALVPLLVPLVALAGCVTTTTEGRPQFSEADTAQVLLPGPPGAPRPAPGSSPPRPLPGVDTSDLTEREQEVFWTLASTLFAPCASEAVSVAVCVEEARACGACAPAARFLADRVRAGATKGEAEAAYGVRFGPNVKKIDLEGSPARGPEGSPVTIVVFSDFECPACRNALPKIDEVVDKLGVRLVHKFYPLKVHPRAEAAARAAVAAHNQGRYWPMEKILFENQQALTDADLLGYARELGLDLARFQADMRSEQTTRALAKDRAEADRAGLQGTPFILINGREFDSTYFRLDRDLARWVELELEASRKP